MLSQRAWISDTYTSAGRQPPRKDKRRQSRRNVWLTLLLFVGVQVGLSAGYALFPNQHDPHYRMATQQAGPVQQGQAHVAILGSSRLALGWQPRALSDAEAVHWLNLAKMGGGTLTMSVYERRLIEDGHDPDLLVLEVNPLFFDRHHWDQEVKANYWPAPPPPSLGTVPLPANGRFGSAFADRRLASDGSVSTGSLSV